MSRAIDLRMKLTSYNLPSIKLDRRFDKSRLIVDDVICPDELAENEKYDLLVVSGDALSLSVNMKKERIFSYVKSWRIGTRGAEVYISPNHKRHK